MDAQDELFCQIIDPEQHELPCGRLASKVYLDLVRSEQFGKPKTIALCYRHHQFMERLHGLEITPIGVWRNSLDR